MTRPLGCLEIVRCRSGRRVRRLLRPGPLTRWLAVLWSDCVGAYGGCTAGRSEPAL
jgi:hypothetical protein